MDGIHSQSTPTRPTQLLPQSGESKGAVGKCPETSTRSDDKSTVTLGEGTTLDRISDRPKGLARSKEFENHSPYHQTEGAKIWSFSDNWQTQSSGLSARVANRVE